MSKHRVHHRMEITWVEELDERQSAAISGKTADELETLRENMEKVLSDMMLTGILHDLTPEERTSFAIEYNFWQRWDTASVTADSVN